MSAGELVPMMIMFWVRKDRDDDAQGGLQLGEDVGDVGFVEGRESKALLAEVVEGCPYVNERGFVDDEEAVVELVGGRGGGQEWFKA